MKVLILGATGMLGHHLFWHLSQNPSFDVYATVRLVEELDRWVPDDHRHKILSQVDAQYFERIEQSIAKVKPQIVINCIGIIKQVPAAQDPLSTITLNSLLPHRIALSCQDVGARMIHVSTDCVFDGRQGNYREDDLPNPSDLYGRTKLLGEVVYPHCVTLRTSMVGHELKGNYGLVEWFLSQEGKVSGYTQAIYSGFPTAELSKIIEEHVIPNPELRGLYHVSADSISKYDLLQMIKTQYRKNIEIVPQDGFKMDRSLDSTRFRTVTGYQPPSWPELIEKMYENYSVAPYYRGSRGGIK